MRKLEQQQLDQVEDLPIDLDADGELRVPVPVPEPTPDSWQTVHRSSAHRPVHRETLPRRHLLRQRRHQFRTRNLILLGIALIVALVGSSVTIILALNGDAQAQFTIFGILVGLIFAGAIAIRWSGKYNLTRK